MKFLRKSFENIMLVTGIGVVGYWLAQIFAYHERMWQSLVLFICISFAWNFIKQNNEYLDKELFDGDKDIWLNLKSLFIYMGMLLGNFVLFVGFAMNLDEVEGVGPLWPYMLIWVFLAILPGRKRSKIAGAELLSREKEEKRRLISREQEEKKRFLLRLSKLFDFDNFDIRSFD